jgi:RNA recognition motif-containing protein
MQTDDEQGKALFLAGLSETCEFTDLHQYFEPYGRVVLCRVLKDAKTGRSRRVGYVNYDNHADAFRAMHALQGKPGPGGAPFDIKIAAQDPTFKPVETKKVFVRYIPMHVGLGQVRDAFAQFGEIEDCVVLRDLSRTARREPGPWNMAYVTYCHTKDAIVAIAKAQSIVRFGDQDLTIKPAVSEETLRLRSKFRHTQSVGTGQAHPLPYGGSAVGGGTGQAFSQPSGQIVAIPPGFVPMMIPSAGGGQPQLVFVPAGQAHQQQHIQQPQQLQQHQYVLPATSLHQPTMTNAGDAQMPFVLMSQHPSFAPAPQQPQHQSTTPGAFNSLIFSAPAASSNMVAASQSGYRVPGPAYVMMQQPAADSYSGAPPYWLPPR